MRILVESLQRLYEDDRVTKEQLLIRVDRKLISIEEYNYLISAKEE